MDSYLTIEGSSKGTFKDKKSSFYGLLYHVITHDEAKNILKQIRKEYYDATHYCYAYRMLDASLKINEHYSDDGEPSNTAGIQILYELRKAELINVLAIVVRYYGGIKLGVPGLIEAYKAATSEAIAHAVIVKKEVQVSFSITCSFNQISQVMNLVKKYSMTILSQEFTENCSYQVECPYKHFDKVKQEFGPLNIHMNA